MNLHTAKTAKVEFGKGENDQTFKLIYITMLKFCPTIYQIFIKFMTNPN